MARLIEVTYSPTWDHRGDGVIALRVGDGAHDEYLIAPWISPYGDDDWSLTFPGETAPDGRGVFEGVDAAKVAALTNLVANFVMKVTGDEDDLLELAHAIVREAA
ncbi:MAG TPA: hypothetical protein VH914_15965 [Acidimicrobiia bacterium]|nr:hypothetical protein [Acidimicrobiia bacterium]